MIELTALMTAALCLAVIAAWLHGLVLSFRSSIILGVICLFLAVPYALIGLLYWATGIDLAQRTVRALPEVFFF